MTTINPCPFCGHDDVEIDEVRPGEYAVDCPECECIGPIKPEIMTAIAAWNGAPQRVVNRDLLAAAKDLIDRINTDNSVLRLALSYEVLGVKHDEFKELYQPKIDALQAAITNAEAA